MSAWRIFIQTIRTAVLSRESFMVFAIASLFYLVFYGMPYDNQIIVQGKLHGFCHRFTFLPGLLRDAL